MGNYIKLVLLNLFSVTFIGLIILIIMQYIEEKSLNISLISIVVITACLIFYLIKEVWSIYKQIGD